MSRFLFIGAHTDDAHIQFTGTAIQLIRKGHYVKFISVCDGGKGHYCMEEPALIERRRREAQDSALSVGVDGCDILGIPDCELENTLQNREMLIRLIRKYHPDVIITHAVNDYHADHRVCGQLVLDTAYLLTLPMYCPDVPIPAVRPIYAHSFNLFTQPRPFRVDAAIAIDSVFEEKLKVLAYHESQFFEWLPWDETVGPKPEKMPDYSPEERRQLLLANQARFRIAADMGREALRDLYGDQAEKVVYAEAFEQTEYGRVLPVHEFRKLFFG